MLTSLPIWFFALNIFTACFGLIYYFTHAYSAKCSDPPIIKIMIALGFISCGVTLFFSIMMLYGVQKYMHMFLFFSWFSVFLSVPFLRRPRIINANKEEKVEDLALIEKPDDAIKRVERRA